MLPGINPIRKNKNKGFTLIELLVVVLLIGVLTGILIGVINPQGIRRKARDAQRKADMKKIQVALELHFSDNRRYPISTGNGWILVTGSDVMSSALTGGGFINSVPVDPLGGASPPSNPCTVNTPMVYRYNYRSNGAYYYLTSIMEINTSDDDSKCTSLANWATNGCTGGTTNAPDVCYGVQNP